MSFAMGGKVKEPPAWSRQGSRHHPKLLCSALESKDDKKEERKPKRYIQEGPSRRTQLAASLKEQPTDRFLNGRDG